MGLKFPNSTGRLCFPKISNTSVLVQIHIFDCYVSALKFKKLLTLDKIERIYLTRKVYAFGNRKLLEHGQISFKAVAVITDHVLTTQKNLVVPPCFMSPATHRTKMNLRPNRDPQFLLGNSQLGR